MSLELQRPLDLLRRLGAGGVEHVRWLIVLPAFSLAYFLAAKLGIATSLLPEGIVILWPPNAIVLVTLLAVRREHWWLFFLVTVATEIAADVPDYPLWAAAGYGIVNFSEAAIAAVLLSRFMSNGSSLVSVRDFLVFLAVGPLLASGTAALGGAAIYKIGAPDLDYLHYWRVFWLGDATGLLIVGTSLLVWMRTAASLRLPTLHEALEAVVLTLGLLAASYWAFVADPELPAVYLVFPFLLWAALRFGVRGASVAVVATVAIAVGSAVSGFGPFVALSGIDTVISLQGLIAVVTLSTFLLAFSTEDLLRTSDRLRLSLQKHRAAEQQLRGAYEELERVNRGLDQTVADRTSKLRSTVSRNEMLLKEVHHRVKNSLQLVASLIGMQSRSVADPALRNKFSEVQGRVAAIASTYDVLHQMETVEEVDFCHVAEVLCRDIDTAGGEIVSVSVSTNGEAPVSADTAVAVSLALNELITNSIKHAAADGIMRVTVSCRRAGSNVLVTVADDGPGFPPDFDVERPGGFGIRMAQDLVARAGGHLRLVRSDSGAVAEISVPTVAEAE